jgi:hypothetical protein
MSESLEALNIRRVWRTEQITIAEAQGGGEAVVLDNRLDRLVTAVHNNTQRDAPNASVGRVDGC